MKVTIPLPEVPWKPCGQWPAGASSVGLEDETDDKTNGKGSR